MPPSNDHIATVQHRERDLTIARSLATIDVENLQREFADTGGEALWWSVLAGQALGDHERAREHLKVVEAEVGNELRAAHARLGEKYTVDSIRDEVALHARVRAAREAIIKALEDMTILQATARNIERKDSKLDSLSRSVGREILANTPPSDPARDRVRAKRGEIQSAPTTTRRQRVD